MPLGDEDEAALDRMWAKVDRGARIEDQEDIFGS